ncbi:hypothetical protein C9374_003257 [Naegleria lovaniensis]|uniref:J domain-containing protein n=1 Tax=Naegleria lovaniensis TaxID=51637 RepID=A0AA88GR06_NAELO|nr:uncharacterized protein C9374_003257 [Naegleria lovaniensis]KAG2385442.1 hypothetical protein C9374_003257 [Naegleria lovaniensis]
MRRKAFMNLFTLFGKEKNSSSAATSFRSINSLIVLQIVIIIVLVNCYLCSSYSVHAASRNDPKGFYEILGLNPSCSHRDIKSAYRKLSLEYHPDRNRNKPESEQKVLKEKYVRICQAYEVLSDENKRQAYSRGFYHDSNSDDSSHESSGHHFHQFHDLSDLFKHFHFGEGAASSDDSGSSTSGQQFRFNPFGSFFDDDSNEEEDDDFGGFHFHFGFPHHQKKASKKQQNANSQSSSNSDNGNKGGVFSGMFDKLKSAFGFNQEQTTSYEESSSGGYREGYQRVKKVVTKIASDGTRTTYVTYEYIPTGQNRRGGFKF